MSAHPRFARRRSGAALVMILAMLGISELFNEREIIFPEMAALCIGLWIVDKRIWQIDRKRLVCLMSLGSLIGIGIVHLAPLSLLWQTVLAFSAAALLLTFSRTTLIPLISAIMLPVLLQTESLVYPISVALMSLLVALGHRLMERYGWRTPHPVQAPEAHPRKELFRWSMLLIGLLLIAALTLNLGWKFCILPPLVVVYTEFATSKAGFRSRPFETWLILLFAISLGTGLQLLLHQWLGLCEVVVGALGMGILFYFFERSGRFFAPAGAILLIPMIVPPSALYTLPLQVATGGLLFILTAMLLFQRCYRWPKAHLIVCIVPENYRHLFKRSGRSKN